MDSVPEFKRLSRIFRALDNETKLSILSLLAGEGAKSVTDISKALKINFSTAHKYLEDLEVSGLVGSKQETRNRLKRMFSVRDFSINLTPKEINTHRNWNRHPKGFKIVTQEGGIETFDGVRFIRPYLEQGLPQGLVSAGINFLRRHVYDGITLLELKYLFKQYLKNNILLIDKAIVTLDEKDIHTRTFGSVLNLLHPKALEQHMQGDIFISNLGAPKLRNCVFDLRGLSLHGINNIKPNNLHDLLNQTIELMDKSKYDSEPTYCLSDFNYFISPLANKSSSISIKTELADFFNLLKTKKCTIYLELDLGDTPKFMRQLPASYVLSAINGNEMSKKSFNYSKYTDISRRMVAIIVDILREQNIRNVIPIIKSWGWDGSDVEINSLSNFYLANMYASKNIENATFVGRLNRFSSKWKGWFGTSRVGEVQNVTINLPRIAINSNSMEGFFKTLSGRVIEVVEYLLNMAELSIADLTRNHDVSRQSVQRVKWDYIRIMDLLYSVSILGLNETVYILSNKFLSENIALGEKILKHCNLIINDKMSNIRIALKEETNPLIADRFFYLDSKDSKSKVNKYSVGVGCKDLTVASRLQNYLDGGHCSTILKSKFDISKALNSKNSLIRVI